MRLYDDYYHGNYEYDQWKLEKQYAEVEIEKLEEEYALLQQSDDIVLNENGDFVLDYDKIYYMNHIFRELCDRRKEYSERF